MGSRCGVSSTPAFRAAPYASSGIGSQAVKTRSCKSVRGTNSLIFGLRFSVRFPRRMVPICDSEPIGSPVPRRTFSTPAMNVVETARSEEHTSELQSQSNLVCRLLLEKKKHKLLQY